MTFRIIGGLALIIPLAGCAGGPSVRPQMAEATGAIRAAKEVGAQTDPQASLHYKLAQENTQLGERLLEEGEDEQARRMFERAELDAELAIALIKQNQAQGDLERVNSELAELGNNLQTQ